jgi:hypothetical protein
MQKRDDIDLAAEAHTNLCLFAAISDIIEGNNFHGARAQSAVEKITEICSRQKTVAFREFEAASARIRARIAALETEEKK